MSESLCYPFPEAPEAGAMLEVAPGVFWLRMPLPFALDHINLWLLEDSDGWTLVDTGIGNDEVKAIWRQLLEGPLAGRPLRRIIVTHFHPDHLGLAGWLSRKTGARVLMSRGEYEQAVSLYQASGGDRNRLQQQFFSSHGLDEERLQQQVSGSNVYRSRVPELPAGYQCLEDGQQLIIGEHRWQVLVGRGHSPEHLCLFSRDAELLIAGDQLLPKISPNVSVSFLNPEANPLSDFLNSLATLGKLPDSMRVLPAHGLVFHGLHARIAALQEHHRERLQLLREACHSPRCAADLLDVLFNRKFGPHELFFALGEAVAHLHLLLADGELLRQQDARGVVRFSSS